MKAVFQGERNTAGSGSGLAGVYNNHHHGDNKCYAADGVSVGAGAGATTVGNGSRGTIGQLSTPPDDESYMSALRRTPSGSSSSSASTTAMDNYSYDYTNITAWLEIWDYAGGNSFRGFLNEDLTGGTTLFAFFDTAVMSRDVKQALMALIDLADSVIGCSQVVICVDRDAPAMEAASLMKGLQWAGFSLITLDAWTGGKTFDVTSPAWVFMGMEL